MPIDISTLPISGRVIVAGLVWAGVSAFALGPLLAERTAEKIGWQEDCQHQVVAAIAARQPEPEAGPSFGCDQVFGSLPPEYRQLMDMFGAGMACDALDQANAQKERLLELRRQHLENVAHEAGSKCSCAVTSFAMTKRWDLALAAGSARLLVPASVSNMHASLLEALTSPACANLAKAED
ncbi:hypothetical protein FJU08_00695 [Martelella alba]|uniref:Uncharacterized protein n=1 Tax=Martelella alba TaxID=2590451 RepID=A0A506UII4_9HYPH|nr:hypothetical protein [Martelella alba]TPW33120.1 hypothetical protein FJU08_00695 [Martelella alba]